MAKSSKRLLDAQAFAVGVLESQDYKTQFIARVKTGTLPPALEMMLYHYAYGKPPDRLELTSLTEDADLTGMTDEELATHAQQVLDDIRNEMEKRKQDQPKPEDEKSVFAKIH